jgi:hypothetical protein
MLRHLIRIGCLFAGGVSGWFVYRNLSSLFDGWAPIAVSAIVFFIVFSLLYFPLFRHLADAADDRLSVVFHRGRHIRSGSGLSEVPEAPKSIICTVCGGPGGPICPLCDQQLTRPPKR